MRQHETLYYAHIPQTREVVLATLLEQADPKYTKMQTRREIPMDSDVLFLIVLVAVAGVLIYFGNQAQREGAEQERLSLIETTSHHIANLATRNIQIKFVAGEDPNIALRDREHVLCVFPNTTLQVPRAVRRSRSVYGGPSIRIAKGLWWRFGESRGISESHDELRAIDVGTLLLTNQRIVFVGSQRTSSVPLEKVINIEGYSDGQDRKLSAEERHADELSI
jgi:hypothetical protein